MLPVGGAAPWAFAPGGKNPCAATESQVADRSVSVPMTLSDLEKRDAIGQIFPADHCFMLVYTTTTFGIVTRGEGLIYMVSATPKPKGLGLSIPKNGIPMCRIRFDLERPNSMMMTCRKRRVSIGLTRRNHRNWVAWSVHVILVSTCAHMRNSNQVLHVVIKLPRESKKQHTLPTLAHNFAIY